jgi:hypothetical protein
MGRRDIFYYAIVGSEENIGEENGDMRFAGDLQGLKFVAKVVVGFPRRPPREITPVDALVLSQAIATHHAPEERGSCKKIY